MGGGPQYRYWPLLADSGLVWEAGKDQWIRPYINSCIALLSNGAIITITAAIHLISALRNKGLP